MTLTEIQAKISNAKALDFGDIFNKSIELFKKVWLQGLLTIIISGALLIPFYILMYLPLIAMGLIDPEAFQDDPSFNFALFLPFIIFLIVFVFYAMFVSFVMRAAFFRICKQKDLGIASSDEYFYFFKKQYVPKVLKLSLAAVGISLLALLLCGLPIIYVSVPISFFSIIFAFNPELSTSEIIKASFDLGNKKWLITFGLTIVAAILAEIVGLLMCLIGILVTASFVYLPLYFIYKEVVGIDDENELNQIGKNDGF